MYIKGSYNDILTDPPGHVMWESGWHSNLVVGTCHSLLSSLMKGYQGMQGILYLAVGSGDASWDSRRPVPQLSDTRLLKEVGRVIIKPDQISFLDDKGEPSKIPTARLEIITHLRWKDIEATGSKELREFGLFGGDATDKANTGSMINRVTHARIDITPALDLTRKLRLNFTGGIIPQEDLTGFGASLPVSSIDGLGRDYANQMRAQGILTLKDLVIMDPLVPVGKIPLVRLREFRAKARMVMRARVSLAPFMPIAGKSISDILSEKPQAIAADVGGGITAEMAAQFQEELAVLQIALDDAQLKKIKLSDLFGN